ncbi:hypothetical protein KIN20_001759 [Parelaphostrongylus tenuis]|uniref:Uncharacterized protein n=1 Tax=Parelaphostrongylus tenuis TaxID=148309 RepID=A0AAD5MFI4_PARTN|nr:hypothetical protein KIN20_001759 [Parelaphostrongylus tenuis]
MGGNSENAYKFCFPTLNSIRRQLDLGIRYLGFRVSYPERDVRVSETDFRSFHALYGPSIQDVLQQVAEYWLKTEKREPCDHLIEVTFHVKASDSLFISRSGFRSLVRYLLEVTNT